jgi:hypothetical protein
VIGQAPRFKFSRAGRKRGHAAITAAQSVRSKGTPEALIRAEMVPALGAVWREDAANQWSALVTTTTNVGTTKTREGGKQTGRSRKRSKTPYSCSALVFSPTNPPHDSPPQPVMRHRDTVRINITSECASQRHSIRGSRISHSGWRARALMTLTGFTGSRPVQVLPHFYSVASCVQPANRAALHPALGL